MNATPDKIFMDSNLWIYLLAESTNEEDANKKLAVANLFKNKLRLTSSAQVLNEVANVLLRKYKYSEIETHSLLYKIARLTEVIDLTKDLSFFALEIKTNYKTSWFDSLIIAAALKSKCTFLYTEDLHHGLVIEDTLTIVNPFKLN